MTSAVTAFAAPTERAQTPVSFSGNAADFFGLLVRGSLLQIPTLGFYRFWLITKIRRHLWANTRVADEAFEYTGTAKEILIGFLVALAILVPIYMVYAAVAFMAEEAKAFASIPLALVLYGLSHFAVYRARRYRATRTTFRGVRFWMTGSGWAYAARAVQWDFLSVATLGLAFPWRAAALERYKMRHTFFGNLQGNFVGTGWELFQRGWTLWVLVVPVPIVLAVIGWAVLGAIIAVLTIILGFPVFLARLTRWQLEGVRFGDIGVASSLTGGAFYGPYLKLFGSLLGLGFVFGIVSAIFAAAVQGPLAALQDGSLDWASGTAVAIAALGYVLFLVGLGVLKSHFMSRGLWAVAAASVMIRNFASVDSVVAAGQPSGSLGEGLADALDFGGL